MKLMNKLQGGRAWKQVVEEPDDICPGFAGMTIDGIMNPPGPGPAYKRRNNPLRYWG